MCSRKRKEKKGIYFSFFFFTNIPIGLSQTCLTHETNTFGEKRELVGFKSIISFGLFYSTSLFIPCLLQNKSNSA